MRFFNKRVGFILLICLFVSIFADAQSYTVNGINYRVTTANSVSVVSGINYSGDITLPSSITVSAVNYSLTGIADSAFLACINLKSIVLPTTITSIGKFAFSHCVKLTTANIPASVSTVGESAFGGCVALKKLSIPASVTSIGDGAFRGCTDSINVATTNTVYSSQSGVLYNKSKTVLIQCPTGATGTFSVPATVTGIADDAFWRCGITAITFPAAINDIGYGAFANSKLSALNLPQVTIIRPNTFNGCNALTNVTLPSTLATVGAGAFWNCILLNTINSNAVQCPAVGDTAVFYDVDKQTATLKVPIGSKSDYQAALGWKDFNIIENITTLKQEFENNNLNINYNRISRELNIVGGDDKNMTISIFSMNGRKCMQISVPPSRSISLQHLPPGVYIVRFGPDSGTQSPKIII